MEICPYSTQISAYHDGELDPVRARQLEQHLESACPPCLAELSQWRRLSGLFAGAPSPKLSDSARQELYQLAPVVREAGIIRLAEWATALAACVLLAVSGWMVFGRTTAAPAPQAAADNPQWVKLAIDPTKTKTLDSVADASADTQFPDWVLTNLGSSGGNE
jgi:anti-sigma factor RsiW